MNKKVQALILTVILILGILIGSMITSSSPGESSIAIDTRSFVSEASYIVRYEAPNYYARNGETGEISFEDEDDEVVIQGCIDDICSPSDGGLIFVTSGNYSCSVTVKSKVLLMLEYGVTGVSYTVTGTGIVMRYDNGKAFIEAALNVTGLVYFGSALDVGGTTTIDGVLNMTGHQVLFGAFHAGTTFPTSPIVGEWFYYTINSTLYVYDGVAWTEPTQRVTIEEYSYTFYKQDSTYYAKSGTTGAVAFSGADADSVVQSAWNTLTSGGTTIFKDLFIIDTILEVPYSYITATGEGWGTGIKCGDNANTTAIKVNAKEGVIISNMQLDGNKDNGGGYAGGEGAAGATTMVWFYNGTTNSMVDNCLIHDAAGRGIIIQTSDYNWITYCNLTDNDGSAIFVSESNENKIIYNNLDGNGHVTGGDNINVGNWAGNGYSARGNMIHGNTIKNQISPKGIHLYTAADYNYITNNRVVNDDRTLRGIAIGNPQSSITECRQNIVSNNRVSGYEVGFQINRGSSNTLNDNSVWWCTVGFEVWTNETEPSSFNIFNDNNIYSTIQQGFLIINSWYNSFEDNVFMSSVEPFKLENSSYNMIHGNFAKDGAYPAVITSLTGPGSDHNSIKDNTFINCVGEYGAAIYISKPADDWNVIEHNSIFSSGNAIFNNGTNTIIRFNKGYWTENSGSASGTSPITVTHNLGCGSDDLTPTTVLITPVTEVGDFYVQNVNSTVFQIAWTGGGTETFYWYCEYRSYTIS